ncbi:MAG: RagB/SusD family nutrient uptake outer membrane protein [Muribaculaceae bacterium]|nr:RagB/SusD family nutrient uptake outer membrane protein [Muribaculaceae bacterium]
MNKIIKAGVFALMAAAFVSCDDVFEPLPENNLPIDYLVMNSSYAENVLGNVYAFMPSFDVFNLSEAGTDDAVSNEANNSWRLIASGSWTSQNNPMNRWEMTRTCIQYCNLLLSRIDDVEWAKDEAASACFHDRFYAEARALRGILMYNLLQAHAGIDNSGELLGIPIVLEPEDATSNFNVPRNTFIECYNSMMEDFNEALKYLPATFKSYDAQEDPASLAELQQKYPGITEGNANRVFGAGFMGRISGQIVQAFISRASLLAASPAFEKSGVTWETAANAAAGVLKAINGISGMAEDGGTWYCDATMDALQDGDCPPEVIWRTEKGESHDRESTYFPPTLYGSGRINPTQNLVDAFPMANGYPITDPLSGYDPQDPYKNRDQRFYDYIIYNGATAGTANTVINTAADSNTNDGLDKITTSTRTGYYMKKHLRMDVNANSSNIVDKNHYTARLRYTEFFLNYAEAANEAWGPTGSGSNGYSAYDVIKALRSRALIGLENGDAYLESCKSSKEEMRKLIRNERRLELCFEGFRFYDLRRWKADLNETAKGMHIEDGVYSVFDVDTRNYKDYMYYGPIPYSETLKFSNLQQNAGW